MNQLKRSAIIASLFLLVIPVLAQGDIILRGDQVNTDEFPIVQVDVTVRDQYGVPVQGLGLQNVTVSEDHDLAPRPVSRVEAVINPDLPIAVVVALDTSGSMQGQPLTDAKTAALRFLDRLSAGDRAAFIAFADTVDLDTTDTGREHPFSDDRVSLYDLVEGLSARGDTPLYDAAYKAVRWAAAEPEGNRAVLLLSDGKEDPGTSGKMGSKTANEDTAIREANRANVPVFTIGLGQQIDEPYLRRLAMETGGTYQKAPDSASLVELFQNVADLLKQQVRITYESGVPGDGGAHTVRVEVRAHERVASDVLTFQAPLLEDEMTAASPTPAPTDTPSPTPSATSVPVASVLSAPQSTPPPWWQLNPLWPWLAAGGGLLLLAEGFLTRRVLKNRRTPHYFCLACGHELTDPEQPCPACGRLGSFKGVNK